MLRRRLGFFGAQPFVLRWKQAMRRTALWSRAGRWAGWGSPPLALRPCRLRARSLLNLALAATAIYFFTGWFDHSTVDSSPGMRVNVWRHDLQRTVAMDLEEYLRGVVAAEMPATFHLEALKAQAVAARTYTLRTMATRSGVPGHPEADLTTDHRIDQAYTDESALRRRYGFLEYYWRWRRICRAVEETSGLVLTYGGELILAVYHSDSGGVTEASENYWSAALPYLRSVKDPVPVTASPYRDTVVTVNRDTLLAKVRGMAAVPAAVPAGAKAGSQSLVELVERYPSGRAQVVRVGDKYVSGRSLREALGLRSTWFTVKEKGTQVEFTVRGNGHGVGMSQYGADAYARQGASFEQILLHYYPGAQLTRYY